MQLRLLKNLFDCAIACLCSFLESLHNHYIQICNYSANRSYSMGKGAVYASFVVSNRIDFATK